MRRKRTKSRAEWVREYRREMRIEGKLKEVEAIKSWEIIAGKAIARRTKKVYIEDSVLYVHLSSPLVRNELMMMKDTLIERMNEMAGETIITSVILR